MKSWPIISNASKRVTSITRWFIDCCCLSLSLSRLLWSVYGIFISSPFFFLFNEKLNNLLKSQLKRGKKNKKTRFSIFQGTVKMLNFCFFFLSFFLKMTETFLPHKVIITMIMPSPSLSVCAYVKMQAVSRVCVCLLDSACNYSEDGDGGGAPTCFRCYNSWIYSMYMCAHKTSRRGRLGSNY